MDNLSPPPPEDVPLAKLEELTQLASEETPLPAEPTKDTQLSEITATKDEPSNSAKMSIPAVVCLVAVVLFIGYVTASKFKPSGSFFHIVRQKEVKPIEDAQPSLGASEKIKITEQELRDEWKLDTAIKLHRLYRSDGMHAAATKVLKDALQKETNPVATKSILNWLVPSLVKEQRYAEAELYARQSIKDQSEKNSHPLELALDYGALGRILVKQNKLPEARDAFEKVLHYRTVSDTKPENTEAYRAYELEDLGAIYCRLGEWKKAVPLLEEALEIHRGHNDDIASVWSLDCLKEAYAALGQKAKSVECDKKLAEIKEAQPLEFSELERPPFVSDRKISSESSEEPKAR